jgi:hypothetical protein
MIKICSKKQAYPLQPAAGQQGDKKTKTAISPVMGMMADPPHGEICQVGGYIGEFLSSQTKSWKIQ